jgi:tetratricopeptide (TPR) repeat protein
MKKITILLALLVFTGSATFAQKSKVTNAKKLKDEGKLEEALQMINEAVDPNNDKSDKTIDWPDTWEVRGDIYQAIGDSTDPNDKKLSNDPLATALESYKKALELDTKNRIANGVKLSLITLINNGLTQQAIDAFKVENYKKALTSFEQILDIQNMNLMKADDPDAVDTVIVFNAGLAAFNAGDFDKAIKYYSEAAKLGYNGARTYPLISSSYMAKKDTVSALNVLKEGFEKYPGDQTVLEGMIQVYIDLKKTDEAMKYLQMAIEKDPNTARYRFAQGRLYEDMGEEAKAIETYQKCLELDPDFFNALYNLGAIYYNKGVEQFNVAKDVPANENAKYEAEMKKADEWFEKSLPFMEKCLTLEPTDRGTLESLKNLYYRLQKMDKYNEVLEKLGQN